MALQVARRLRTLLKLPDLPAQLRNDWTLLEQELSSKAQDPDLVQAELDKTTKATIEAESEGKPGIYVYTLPHYLRYPFDPDTGKTLLKVGHSSTDVLYRVDHQKRFTALPEDPILLRIYPAKKSVAVENRFHLWLKKADHRGPRTKRAGSEWFVTSTKFLDHIAESLCLEIQVVNDIEVGDE